jgi:hypothetical protein
MTLARFAIWTVILLALLSLTAISVVSVFRWAPSASDLAPPPGGAAYLQSQG